MTINPQPITVIDTEELLVSVIPRDSRLATICFTGIGHAVGGVDIQSFEFLKSSQNSTTIFIVDRKRSWGNNIIFDDVLNAIAKYIEGKIVNTIGNSMGGFLAVLITRYITTKNAIAFVPQFSVNKKIVPNEMRFDSYVNKITNWKHESLLYSFNETTNYYIFFGEDDPNDVEQRKFFPIKKNIFIFLFKNIGWGHNVAQKLKESKVLYSTIENCLEQINPDLIISKNLSEHNVHYLNPSSDTNSIARAIA